MQLPDSELRDDLKAVLAAARELSAEGDEALIDAFLVRASADQPATARVFRIRQTLVTALLIGLTWLIGLGTLALRAWYYYTHDSDASSAYYQSVPIIILCACAVTALVLLMQSLDWRLPLVHPEINPRPARLSVK